MHVVEQYALACGAQISPPIAPISYLPIPFNRYIAVSSSAEVNSKKYDHYPEVMDLIHPFLKEQGIEIVQIGHKDDPPLKNAHQFLGTTKKHINYIVKGTELVLSNDFYTSHIASIFDKKLVTLFSPLYKETSKPFWGAPENQFLIESHRNGEKPSFVGDEKDYKRINLIHPEVIAKGLLNLLNIPHDLDSIETLHMGQYFSTPIIEVVPDCDPDPNLYNAAAINIRLDLNFDPELMTRWAFNRKLNIITDQKIDRKYLDIIRPHVAQVMFKVSKDISADDIRELQEGGYQTYLCSKEGTNITDIRLNLIDWDINLEKEKEKKDLDNASKICDNTYFKSSKTMTSKNKHYSSLASYKAGVEKHENEKIIDSPEFWSELDYLRIYNK